MFVDISTIPPAIIAAVCGGALVCVALSFWAIWHAFWRVFPYPQERFIWLAIAVFIPFFGGLIYLLWGAKRGRRNAS